MGRCHSWKVCAALPPLLFWLTTASEAQTTQKGASQPVPVMVQKQLYVYKDAKTGIKYLGHTSDLVHLGELYKTLSVRLDQVSFISCEKTRLVVTRNELKKLPGDCEGELEGWGQKAGVALEGRFLGVQGQTATFALPAKDGTLTEFSLPGNVIVGIAPKKNSKVLFTKDPTLPGTDFAKSVKILESVDTAAKVRAIKDGGFTVFAGPNT